MDYKVMSPNEYYGGINAVSLPPVHEVGSHAAVNSLSMLANAGGYPHIPPGASAAYPYHAEVYGYQVSLWSFSELSFCLHIFRF